MRIPSTRQARHTAQAGGVHLVNPTAGLLVFALFLCLTSTSVRAQGAIFSVASNPVVVISTARTALTGPIIFSITSGITGPGSILVEYRGVSITNDSASGVTAVASWLPPPGMLPVSVDKEASLVTILVPAGGGAVAMDTITLDGVRIDIFAAQVSQVSAAVSATIESGFNFIAGKTDVKVVSGRQDGLVVDPDSDTVLSILGPPPVPVPLRFTLEESSNVTFSDAIGTFGQNVATAVQIKVLGIPEGVEIAFPALVTDVQTGGTLMVPVGDELTLPTSSGGTDMTYVFTSGLTSAASIDRFRINYTPDITASYAQPEVVSLQATLFPNDAPNIPRFATQLFPSDEDLPLPEFEDIIPSLQGVNEFLGLALTSASSLPYTVTLEAFSTPGTLVSGSDLVNPATLILPVGAQTSGLLEDFFGPGIVGSDLGSVVVRGRRRRPVSLFFLGDQDGTQLDGATGRQVSVREFVFPNLGRGDGAFTIVHLFNPSLESAAQVTLILEDLVGSAIDLEVIDLPPRGTFSDHASNIFQFSPESFQGRVRGSADPEVAVFESFGNAQAVNALSGQAVGRTKGIFLVPHFVAGLGFDTEVTVINVDSLNAANLEIALLDEAGTLLPQAMPPAEIVLARGDMRTLSLSALFGLGADTLVAGSIRVTSQKVFKGPVSITPAVSGSVRFFATDERQSATLPLFNLERTVALYPHVAQNLGFYTGLAVVNPKKVEVTVTVEVFDENGVLVGSENFVLSPGGRNSLLLNQLVPASNGQLGGYFRVTATAGIISFALFGDLAGNVISVIPAQ